MKIILISITFTLFALSFCKSLKETSTIESVAYALGKAKMDEHYMRNQAGYRSVPYVDKLPPQTPISDGQVETVDEITTESNYYDGTIGLKTVITSCNMYTTQPQVCLHQGSCGWCGSTSSCIQGNNLGPLAPCLRGTYVFTAPTPDWNPIQGGSVTKVNFNGATLTKIEK